MADRETLLGGKCILGLMVDLITLLRLFGMVTAVLTETMSSKQTPRGKIQKGHDAYGDPVIKSARSSQIGPFDEFFFTASMTVKHNQSHLREVLHQMDNSRILGLGELIRYGHFEATTGE